MEGTGLHDVDGARPGLISLRHSHALSLLGRLVPPRLRVCVADVTFVCDSSRDGWVFQGLSVENFSWVGGRS